MVNKEENSNMGVKIHPSSVISPKAEIGTNVEIGPFCCVGDLVKLHDGIVLKSHVCIDGNTTIGEGTTIFPFASIGMAPQALKNTGENTTLIIGKNNLIREYATMQPGTQHGTSETRVGDGGLFMAGTHIAHDCQIGNNVIMANYATLAGHVRVGDNVIIGGLAAVQQFVNIGKNAFIGGMAGVKYDVIPYAMVMGKPDNLDGLNLVGLKRLGLARDDISEMLKAYDMLFDKQDNTLMERLTKVEIMYANNPQVMEILNFIKQDSSRNLCLPAK